MAGLKELLDLTVRYIFGEWHKKEPKYVENPQFHFLPYYDQDETTRAIFPPILVEGIPESHIRIGETVEEDKILEKIDKNIEDSTKIQIVEFCSFIGINFSHFFAKRHGKIEYTLIDKLENEEKSIEETTFADSFKKRLRKRNIPEKTIEEIYSRPMFIRYEKHVDYRGDVEDFINRVFIENDVSNMHLKRLELTSSTNISDIIKPKKKLYCWGWNCPAEAGIYALQQSVKHNAEAIAISISGMEFIPDEIQQLSTHVVPEWQKIMKLAKGIRIDGKVADRYNYGKPDERKLGFALKHVRALDILLWLQEKGYNTKTIFFKPNIYNGTEHLIYAYKKHDILA